MCKVRSNNMKSLAIGDVNNMFFLIYLAHHFLNKKNTIIISPIK